MGKFRKIHFWRCALKAILTSVIVLSLIIGGFTEYLFTTVRPYSIDLAMVNRELAGIPTSGISSENDTQAVLALKNESNLTWVDLSDVPKNLTNAIVSTEDKNFYTNDGVDYKRTLAAAVNTVFHFYGSNEGGSTITQQVIKNIEGNINDRTYQIKLKEIATALKLNQKYTKNQILETYINVITLGNGCYGVQTATYLYFGKNVKDLDLAQCAALASIIPSPNLTYDPYKHPGNVRKRSELVLKNMLDQEMITKSQYTQAISEKITFLGH